MPGILSERIAALRKERGLTQEQLGKMVGVSSQAVGKWEKGGAPDVELLPVLAGQLGVTVDALFGLDGGEKIDIKETVGRWITTVPKGQRLDQICRLVWAAAGPAVSDEAGECNFSRYVEHFQTPPRTTADGEKYLMLDRTRIILEEGLLLGARAKDMSYAAVFPEPEAGWDSFLADNSLYRRFFALLARPHCLEVLEYLQSKPGAYERNYTPGAIAKRMGLDVAEVQELLESLADLHVLLVIDLETEDGDTHAFCLYEREPLVPFLSFAYWMLAGGGITGGAHLRESAILRGEKWKEEGEN